MVKMEVPKPLVADIVFEGVTYVFDVLELHELVMMGVEMHPNGGIEQYAELEAKILEVTGMEKVFGNQLHQLAALISDEVDKFDVELKKKRGLDVNSADSTPPSPPDGSSGTGG